MEYNGIEIKKAFERPTGTMTEFEAIILGREVSGRLFWDSSGYWWEIDGLPEVIEEFLDDGSNEDELINAIEAIAENGTGAK